MLKNKKMHGPNCAFNGLSSSVRPIKTWQPTMSINVTKNRHMWLSKGRTLGARSTIMRSMILSGRELTSDTAEDWDNLADPRKYPGREMLSEYNSSIFQILDIIRSIAFASASALLIFATIYLTNSVINTITKEFLFTVIPISLATGYLYDRVWKYLLWQIIRAADLEYMFEQMITFTNDCVSNGVMTSNANKCSDDTGNLKDSMTEHAQKTINEVSLIRNNIKNSLIDSCDEEKAKQLRLLIGAINDNCEAQALSWAPNDNFERVKSQTTLVRAAMVESNIRAIVVGENPDSNVQTIKSLDINFDKDVIGAIFDAVIAAASNGLSKAVKLSLSNRKEQTIKALKLTSDQDCRLIIVTGHGCKDIGSSAYLLYMMSYGSKATSAIFGSGTNISGRGVLYQYKEYTVTSNTTLDMLKNMTKTWQEKTITKKQRPLDQQIGRTLAWPFRKIIGISKGIIDMKQD